MTFAGPIAPAGTTEGTMDETPDTVWRRHVGGLALATLLILALFHRDAIDMVTIWWRSETFGHCLLIPFVLAWLVWQRWPELRAAAVPTAWLPGLLPIAAGSVGWLLGEAAGVAFARHLGLVMMLQGAVIALLGPRVSRGLAFPIFYMLFLVPFGEALVPPLQTLTASMCMALLALVGIPAHIDGVFITTPNGYFEVAAACAGVNFLIAMIAYGALVSNICFLSWRRRVVFMTLSVVVPVIANGIRAWGTIYVAETIDLDFAASFDHVLYGWFFFAFVMALVMLIAWPFFDRPRRGRWVDGAAIRAMPARTWPIGVVAAGLVAATCLPPLWSIATAARGQESIPGPLHLPEVAGWQRVPIHMRYPWKPRFDGADHWLFGRYRNAQGQEVDLAVTVFADQSEGRELIGYGQGAVDPESKWAWTGSTRPPAGGAAERITAPGPVVREVVSFYRVGDTVTGSPTRVKLETMQTRLTGGRRRAVAVLVSAEEVDGKSARPAIDAMIAALGPIDALADHVADGR